MKRKHRFSGMLSLLAGDLFEEPSEAVPGGWSVTVTDGREAYITGCRAILSYDPETICVDIGSDGELLSVRGSDLDISRYTDREITIRGGIESVTVEKVGKRGAQTC